MGFLRDTFAPRLGRDLDDPVAGTNVTLWPAIANWRAENLDPSALYISPEAARKIWVAERCIQLNAQQIAAMPVRFRSSAPQGGFEPAWIANPDPNWYPNGISDALFAIIRNLYGRGYALLWITARYASGFPSAWTVLDPRTATIEVENGRRVYKIGDELVPSADIVQIDRNPGSDIHGTSALSAFASVAWGNLAATELARTFLSGGVPQAVLKSERNLDSDQAESVQSQWVSATSRRGGAPAILPPDLSFETLSISPADLALLEAQEFGARVIAAAYGVPAILLNIPMTGGLNYQNPALLGEQWWRFELRTTAKRVADAWTAQMLPRGNWVELDASDTFAPITTQDDTQLSNEQIDEPPATAGASPADGSANPVVPIRAVGG